MKKVSYSSNGFNKLRAGLPFVVLLAGGSIVLSTFVQGTVEGRDKRVRSATLPFSFSGGADSAGSLQGPLTAMSCTGLTRFNITHAGRPVILKPDEEAQLLAKIKANSKFPQKMAPKSETASKIT